MNPNVRVVNTAPLIFLSKIGKLELLRIGAELVYAPVTALSELSAVQDESNKAVQGILGTWLLEKACSQPNLLALAAQALDPGEAGMSSPWRSNWARRTSSWMTWMPAALRAAAV